MADFRLRARALAAVAGAAFRADAWSATAVFLMAILSQAAIPVMSLATGWLTDGIVAGSDAAAYRAVGVLVALVLGTQLTGMLSFPMRMILRERTQHVLDIRLIEMGAGMAGLEHFERPDYADKLLLLRQQSGLLAGAVDAVVWNVAILVNLLTTSWLLFRLDPVLGLVPIAGIPLGLAFSRDARQWEKRNEALAEEYRVAAHLAAVSTRADAGKEIRVFGLRRELPERWRRLRGGIDRVQQRGHLQSAAVIAAAGVFFAGVSMVAISVLLGRLASGRSGVGDLVVAVGLAGQVRGLVAGLGNMSSWLIRTTKAAERFVWFRDLAAAERVRLTPPEPAPAPAHIADGIHLESVTFRYPGTDRDVLRDVDLRFPAGSTVAIVGDNGAGKSTLVKLLARYYEPTEGRITVDGIDLARIPIDDWRAVSSAGFQDFARFELIAAESVGVGDLAHVDDEVAIGQALDRAAAEQVVEELPGGLNSMLGRSFEGGVEISGGQWQKLALGRAMMRPAPLLLLMDEPTAALDAATEHAQLDRYMAAGRIAARETGAITVLVSHRFSTVRTADLIVVVGDHGVIETGTHAELMAGAGVYAELYELQARSYR